MQASAVEAPALEGRAVEGSALEGPALEGPAGSSSSSCSFLKRSREAGVRGPYCLDFT